MALLRIDKSDLSLTQLLCLTMLLYILRTMAVVVLLPRRSGWYLLWVLVLAIGLEVRGFTLEEDDGFLRTRLNMIYIWAYTMVIPHVRVVNDNENSILLYFLK
jgi:hypothetical protein